MRKFFFQVFIFLPAICLSQPQVFYNAKIFTANPQQPFAEAIAINGKIITAVGNFEEVKKKAGSKATLVDLNGGFLMPGLIDTHNHGVEGGMDLTKANVNENLISVSELLSYAKNELNKKDGMTGDVLVIYGVNISIWKNLDDLNKVFNSGEFENQPLVLRGSDYHTSWNNKAMMTRAGVSKAYVATLQADDRKYFETNTAGEPTGFITESGFRKIASALPKETDFSVAAEKAMSYNNAFGITAWLDPTAASFTNTKRNSLEWYQYLIDKKKLTAHIAATVVADISADHQAQIKKLKQLQKKYNTTDFSIIGFKVFADGVIEYPTQTAALSIPYTGTTSKGDLIIDPKKFAQFATMADKENLLVHVHAIGDRAVTVALDGIELARKTNQNLRIPHTITHLQIVRPSDFARFARLNVLASFQLLWAFGDITTIDIVKPYIDPSLYQWQYPARSMLQAGVTVTGSSDWPVSTANVFEAVYRAETRNGPMGVLDSTQCMPRLAMLYAYTSEAAKALMMEKSIGSLQEGKSADMILVDRDVLTVKAESLMDARVIWTIFEGKKVYGSPVTK